MHQSTDKKNKIILYLIFLFVLSTTTVKFKENQNDLFSTINQININGLPNNEKLKILNELNDLLYQNILIIRKDEVKKIINKYNIIEEYSVKIIYPSTININIKPTKLIAKISNVDQLFVGANGKIIKDKKNNEILPYIFGKFDSENFLLFKDNIEKSMFTFAEFKTLYIFPSNRWDILTNNSILIKLPQDNFSKSLNLAYKILRSDDFIDKNFIDLRMKNHLIIK